MRQPLARRSPRCRRRERADVHLVDDLPMTRRRTVPSLGSTEGARIDDHRRAEGAIRLKARDGIGTKPLLDANQ